MPRLAVGPLRILCLPFFHKVAYAVGPDWVCGHTRTYLTGRW
jgi:hypothetical protein